VKIAMSKILMVALNRFVNDARILKECRALSDNGYRVHILALHEEGLPETEECEHYSLKRMKLFTRSWPKIPLVQSIKYFECVVRMTIEGMKEPANVIHCHDIGALPVGYLINRMKRRTLIYDSHELWSEYSSIEGSYLKKKLFSVLTYIESFMMRRSNVVITVSDSIADHLANKNDIERPIVIKNVPYKISDDVAKGGDGYFRRYFNLSQETKLLLYQGCLGRCQDLEELVLAMQYVDGDAVLIMLGNGPLKAELRELVKQEGLGDKVYFHEPVKYEGLLKYTSEATLGFSMSSNKTLNYSYCLPNKLFEYVQAGVPVVATELPEMGRVVRDGSIGETYAQGDPNSIAQVVNRILGNDGLLGEYRSNVAKYALSANWEIEQEKLLAIYKNLYTANVGKAL
jgi:glycosyltransferase involved in cell wall biosynthesis